MFKNLKSYIREIAVTAVKLAEEKLGSNKGKEKKKLAIEYIVSHLPIPAPFNILVSMLLSSFIDDAIEFSVKYIKEV